MDGSVEGNLTDLFGVSQLREQSNVMPLDVDSLPDI
jgi:hypothetical protein